MRQLDETSGAESGAPIAEPLERNIETLMRRRAREVAQAGVADKVAAAVAGFAGSLWSAIIHALIFGLWVLINLGVLPLLEPWDPQLIVLATLASVESIFLTTFVLMNQNRLARTEDKRAELTLQISLLAEHEMTKLVELASAITDHFNINTAVRRELEELAEEIAPEAVLDEIERRQRDKGS
jgi:uncharacterized membrane protein